MDLSEYLSSPAMRFDERLKEFALQAGACNRPAAEQVVVRFYKLLGRRVPQVIWFSSPPEAIRAVSAWTVMRVLVELLRRKNRSKWEPDERGFAVFQSAINDLPQYFMLGHNLEQQPGHQLDNATQQVYHAFWHRLSNLQLALMHDSLPYTAALGELRNETRAVMIERWQESIQSMFQHLSWTQAQPATPLNVTSLLKSLTSHQVPAENDMQAPIRKEEWISAEKVLFGLHPVIQRDMYTQSLNNWNIPINFSWTIRGRANVYSMLFAEALHHGQRQEDREQTDLNLCEGCSIVRGSVMECGSWWPTTEVCFMSERLESFYLNANLRPHCENAPALIFPDRWSVYLLNGVLVNEEIASGKFTLADIRKEENAERRREMIKLYGYEKYILDEGAIIVNSDEYGTLYKIDNWRDWAFGLPELRQIVKVTNSTPEPDGSRKVYFLQVPPEVTSAHEAVAWTFGFDKDDYYPSAES